MEHLLSTTSLHYKSVEKNLDVDVVENNAESKPYYTVSITLRDEYSGVELYLTPNQFHQLAVDIASADYKLNPSRFIHEVSPSPAEN